MKRISLVRILAVVVLFVVMWCIPGASAAEEPWFNTFLQILEKNSSSATTDAANAFGLIDVDLNGTPELLVGIVGAKKNTFAHIYRYVNGQARRCGSVKMGSIDWDMQATLYTNKQGYAVWAVTTVDARKVEADVREYVLSLKKNGDTQAKERFRYRILFSGKTTYFVNGKKASDKAYRTKYNAWKNQLTPVEAYEWETWYADRGQSIATVLREAANEYQLMYTRVFSQLRTASK